MLLAGEGFSEEADAVANVIGRVDVERRSVLLGERVKGDLAACERQLACEVNKRANGNQATSERNRNSLESIELRCARLVCVILQELPLRLNVVARNCACLESGLIDLDLESMVFVLMVGAR